ncbi:hypothetical protein C8Q77DRAFT_1100826 [Trametes polyzona]|nr:hypothetical protein C8Q77DRAFT_1100826 [Trametes polyzona]
MSIGHKISGVDFAMFHRRRTSVAQGLSHATRIPAAPRSDGRLHASAATPTNNDHRVRMSPPVIRDSGYLQVVLLARGPAPTKEGPIMHLGNPRAGGGTTSHVCPLIEEARHFQRSTLSSCITPLQLRPVHHASPSIRSHIVVATFPEGAEVRIDQSGAAHAVGCWQADEMGPERITGASRETQAQMACLCARTTGGSLRRLVDMRQVSGCAGRAVSELPVGFGDKSMCVHQAPRERHKALARDREPACQHTYVYDAHP